MLNIPYFQRKMTVVVTEQLEEILDTKLSIKRIDIGLLNRLVIDGLQVKDQRNRPLLTVSRFSASFEILPLFQGKISIRSVQLYGMNASLYKTAEEAPLNCQFLIDAFSGEESREKSRIDLRINSLLVRQGTISYDLFSQPRTPERFNASHLRFTNLSTSISLKHFSADSVHVQLKRMSVKEQSGLELTKLKFHFTANRQEALLAGFECNLPKSVVKLSDMTLRYKNLSDMKHLADSLFFSVEVLPSTLMPTDFAPLLPALARFSIPLHFDMAVDGRLNYLNVRDIHLYSSHHSRKGIELQGNIHLRDLLHGDRTYLDANLRSHAITPDEIAILKEELAVAGVKLPEVLNRLETFTLRTELTGYLTDLVVDCALLSETGKLHTVLNCRRQEAGYLLFGDIQAENLQIGTLLQEEKLGAASFLVKAEAMWDQRKFSSVKLQGDVQSVEYLKYNYQHILFDGMYDFKGFNGQIALNDPNADVLLSGKFNLESALKEYHLTAKLRHFKPYNLNLTKEYEGNAFTLLLDADLKGNKVEDMIGTVLLDSVIVDASDKQYTIPHTSLVLSGTDDSRRILLDSPFAEGDIQGRFDYSTLSASVLNMLKQYIPSLLNQGGKKSPDNDFRFSVAFYDTHMLTEIFKLPLTIHKNSAFSGFIKDATHTMQLRGKFPDLSYGAYRFHDAVLSCDNTPQSFDCNVSADALMKSGELLSLSLLAQASEDHLNASFEWENEAEVEYKGKLSASAFLHRNTFSNKVLADIYLLPTDVVMEDSLWSLDRANIQIDSSRIHISGFRMQHAQQSVHINGDVSGNAGDSVRVDLQNFNLGYLFNVIDFHPVEFDGLATGVASVHQLLSTPTLRAAMKVKNFLFNDALLGDMDLDGGWDPEQDAIRLNGRMQDQGVYGTHVVGEVWPKRKGLDLKIKASGTNISFIQPFVEGTVSSIRGRVAGDFRLFGGFSSLAVEGKGRGDASFHVDILGTSYHLEDSVTLYPERFVLNNARISDLEGHPGTVSATLSHKYFQDFTYRLRIQSEGMMVLHKRETFDLPFYGKIYANGNATLTGNSERLDVNATLTTTNHSDFCYKMISPTSATSSAFVQFQRPSMEEDSLSGRSAEVVENTNLDVHLNLLLEATPQVTMKVLVDPRAGDYISCTGMGNIRMDYFNKGDLRMFGTYTVNQGVYKFSLQEVIRKDFLIRNGSTVSFNGDPYRAISNLNAAYTVNGVSLRDLGNDVINVLQTKQNSIRVNCLMDITGMISSPEIRLGLELPNENEEVQRVVRNFISTDDQMNMQILYLLGIGKFYTPDYANKTGQNSDAMSAVLSSTLSGQLNNMLSQMINSNTWNFGVNGSTGEEGWTDMEFQGMLSGQLLNNRLLVNGNFGYRDNSVSNSNQQSNFIGDFDIEYLLTKAGDVRLKAYNKSNDRYSTKTTLNTQGIGVMYKKDFNSWWDLLPWRKKKKKELLQ